MIKKWSYVVAAAATVFGGSILTGCIDNDEPFGITQIRVETANLLKAKQALVSADAAAKLAQAELDKANAEIARINAEVAKAQAESAIKLAELEKQAEIAQTEAQTALIKAQIDHQKAITEAYIAEKKAKVDNLIAQNEIKIKNMQLAYDKLVYEWELIKIRDGNVASSFLFEQVEAAYRTYLGELDNYNRRATELAKAQRFSNQWLNNLMYEDGKWVQPQDAYKKDLQEAIDNAQKNVDDAQKAIDEYNASIADLENVKTNNDVYKKWTELNDKIETNNAKMAELKIEKESIDLNNQPLLNEIASLGAAYQAVLTETIDIPAYTFEPTEALKVIGMTEPEVIVPANQTYTLEDYNAYQAYLAGLTNPQAPNYNDAIFDTNNYAKYVKAYVLDIANRKDYLLDDNDVAWTNARLEELKRQQATAQATYDADETQWEAAKKVYNDGKEVDVTDFPGEAELEKAIADYNALGAKFDALEAKIATTNAEYKEAADAYAEAVKSIDADGSIKKAWDKAQKDYEEAIQTADVTYKATVAEAALTQKNADLKADQELLAAKNEKDRAQALVDALKAEQEVNPNKPGLADELTAANTALTTATNAYNTLNGNIKNVKADAEKAYKNAIAAADTQLVKDQNKAGEDLDAAQTTWVNAGLSNPDIQTLAKAVEEKSAAQQALKPEINALKKEGNGLCDALTAAYDAQLADLNLSYWPVSLSLPQDVNNYITALKNGKEINFVEVGEAPIYTEQDGIYVNAKFYLIQSSLNAFGPLGVIDGYWYWDNSERVYVIVGYNGVHEKVTIEEVKDEAFLVDEVTTAMLNEYVKSWFNKKFPYVSIEDYECAQFYNRFGSFGELKYLENRIEVAKAYIENSDLCTSALETLNENLAALESSAAPVKEKADKAQEAWQTKVDEYNDLFTEINKQFNDLVYENYLMSNVIAAINTNFGLLNDMDIAKPAAVEGCINYLKNLIVGQEKEKASAEEALAQAQNNYDLFINAPEQCEYVYNPYEAQVELLTAQLEVSKEKLDAYKSRLEELQARYEAAAAKQ